MKKKIWAVSEGAYSDYRVVAVFEREGDAEAFVNAHTPEDIASYRGPRVECLPFYPAGEGPKPTPRFRSVWMERGWQRTADGLGSVAGEVTTTVGETVFDEKVPRAKVLYRYCGSVDGDASVAVQGTDREAVLKTLTETVAGFKLEIPLLRHEARKKRAEVTREAI